MNRTKYSPDWEGRNPLQFQEEIDKIQQREKEYQILFEAAPYPSWILDLATLSILAVNEAALLLYGYTRHEFLGLTLTDLIAADDTAKFLKSQEDDDRLDPITPSISNWKHRKKDGKDIDVEVNSRPVFFHGRSARMVIANVVTEERRQAEEVLRKKESELRLLIEQMPYILWSTDTELRFTSLMGAGLAALNMKPGEATGMSLYEYFGTRDPSFKPIEAHRRALEGGSMSYDLEWMGRTFQAHVEPLREATGVINGAIGVALDITERKFAEEKLREAEAKFRTLVEQIPAITYIAQFGGSGRWLYVSPQIEKILGYSPAEWIGNCELWFKHIHPDDQERVLNEESECHGTGKPFRSEYRMLDRNGKQIWFLDEAFVVRDPGDQPLFLQGVMFDITERKRAEEAIRETQDRYEVIARATNDAVWDWDLSNDSVRWSEGVCTLFGYSLEEAEAGGADWWNQHIHAADRERTLHGIDEKIKSGDSSWSDEYRYLRSDGSYAYVLDRGYVLRDAQGKALRMIGAMMDISELKRAEETARESEARTRMVLDTALDAVVTIDAGGKITEWNKQAEAIFGWSRDEAIGRLLHETIIPQRYREGHRVGLKRFFETGEGPILNSRFEIAALHRYGHEFLVELTITPIRFGETVSFGAFIRDITEAKQSEILQSALYRVAEKANHAEDMQEFYKAIHGIVGELMYAKNFYIALFDKPTEMLSFPYFVDEVDTMPEPQKLGKGLTEFVLRTGEALLASPEKFEELIKTGEAEPVGTASLDWLGAPLKTGDNTFGVLVVQSYSEFIRFGEKEKEVLTYVSQHIANALERKRSEETIRHQAYHDALTKLPNRMLFKDRMTQALAHAHRDKQMLAMLFLDLDRFKIINDTLGHAVGDKLLQSVADRLRKCLREGDTVARLGGDEFMLLLSGIHHVEDAAKIADKILGAIRPPFQIESHELYINTSIGISLYPYDGEDAETLVKNADIALYRAKERGRDNYQFYASAMNAKAIEQLELENKLRRALERNEFVLHYQPQIDMYMGRIIGMEALVRWQRPDGKLVPPLDFISLAEDTGMIVPLGEWVLKTACAQNRLWQTSDFPPLRVAVNLSGRQFQQNLVQTIEKVIKKTGLDPQYLELELTETAIMKNDKVAIETLNELKSMGIQICIDDFGTGYSSLSYLKRFPIDTLKIDQSFIRDSMIDADHAAIVTAIITMAHSLKLKVVAEGVETKEQWAFLRAHNCDKMQGSLFSEALSAEAFTRLITEFQEFKLDDDEAELLLE